MNKTVSTGLADFTRLIKFSALFIPPSQKNIKIKNKMD